MSDPLMPNDAAQDHTIADSNATHEVDLATNGAVNASAEAADIESIALSSPTDGVDARLYAAFSNPVRTGARGPARCGTILPSGSHHTRHTIENADEGSDAPLHSLGTAEEEDHAREQALTWAQIVARSLQPSDREEDCDGTEEPEPRACSAPPSPVTLGNPAPFEADPRDGSLLFSVDVQPRPDDRTLEGPNGEDKVMADDLDWNDKQCPAWTLPLIDTPAHCETQQPTEQGWDIDFVLQDAPPPHAHDGDSLEEYGPYIGHQVAQECQDGAMNEPDQTPIPCTVLEVDGAPLTVTLCIERDQAPVPDHEDNVSIGLDVESMQNDNTGSGDKASTVEPNDGDVPVQEQTDPALPTDIAPVTASQDAAQPVPEQEDERQPSAGAAASAATGSENKEQQEGEKKDDVPQPSSWWSPWSWWSGGGKRAPEVPARTGEAKTASAAMDARLCAPGIVLTRADLESVKLRPVSERGPKIEDSFGPNGVLGQLLGLFRTTPGDEQQQQQVSDRGVDSSRPPSVRHLISTMEAASQTRT